MARRYGRKSVRTKSVRFCRSGIWWMRGVHVSLATDNVPPSLFVPIGHAVSRLTEQGRVLGPDQKL